MIVKSGLGAEVRRQLAVDGKRSSCFKRCGLIYSTWVSLGLLALLRLCTCTSFISGQEWMDVCRGPLHWHCTIRYGPNMGMLYRSEDCDHSWISLIISLGNL
jgi:hypothetical protein